MEVDIVDYLKAMWLYDTGSDPVIVGKLGAHSKLVAIICLLIGE